MAVRVSSDGGSLIRRSLIAWGLLVLLVLGALGAALGALGKDLYSASGFVTSYLDALARHDMRSLGELDGVAPSADGSRQLLHEGSLGQLRAIAPVREEALPDGRIVVTVAYEMAARDSDVWSAQQSSFLVERTGSHFVIFDSWRFAESPVRQVAITVQHDRRFTANGAPVTGSGVAAGTAAQYLLYSPGSYLIDYQDDYLSAEPRELQLTGGDGTELRLNLSPTPAFISRVERELGEYLDTCATQTVLQPTGCPFGQFLSDRIQSEPEWSITSYPEVSVTSGIDGWLVPRAAGRARLVVERVQSLFDGSIYRWDEAVPFRSSYRVSFELDGSLTIQALPE